VSGKVRLYWDASVFIALIQNEVGRAETCARLFSDAEAGRFQIFTSVLTIAECSGGRAVANMAERELHLLNEAIRGFMEHACLTMIQVDRAIAEHAQSLQQWGRRELGRRLPPTDAIHLASAIRARASVLHTYDDDHLTPLDGKTPPHGNEPLSIRHPGWTGTLPLFPSESVGF